ncbi:MAG: hypothetical protein B6I28_05510 [Fusobacteriia bacterium 4572_132]|nr:MAG: hypothetical protein B6I28_05510 [Fusobacteriia bacterium 4572_132]
MLKEAVYHKVNSDYVYPIAEDKLLIKIRTKKDDVKNIKLNFIDKYFYIRNNKIEMNQNEMKKVATDDIFDYYETIVIFDVISLTYYFEMEDNAGKKIYYGNNKFQTEKPTHLSKMFIMPTIAKKDLFIVPEWTKDSIVYQIFPERFKKGGENESKEWYENVKYDSFLGGNIQGIIEKLDYLEELGINTIYLNPIFKSNTNHKYNTDDYYEIDEEFGTKADFKELVEKSHKKNIRIVLDAVFNHTGINFFGFQDVLEKGEDSEYADWFEIEEHPVRIEENPNYKTFGHHPYMPKVMMENKENIQYFIDVAKYWVKEFDIDGWRLDVADEISQEFWKKMRREIRLIKKDVMIVGEIWYDSSSWLQGDQFDSVMNYMFYDAVEGFIAKNELNVTEFSESLGKIRGLYKIQAYNAMWNLIDSHDTSRFLYRAKESIKKLKLASLIQMTYTGIPTIYYGDELGMSGGDDPHCRKGMIWDEDKQNKKLLEYYKKIIKIRNTKKALRYGDFSEILKENERKLYGYKRKYKDEEIYVYLNNGTKKVEIKIDGEMYDLLNAKKVNNKIIINAKTGVILEKSEINKYINFEIKIKENT